VNDLLGLLKRSESDAAPGVVDGLRIYKVGKRLPWAILLAPPTDQWYVLLFFQYTHT
jgi:Na+/melibiose symporter-like transporter